MTFPMETLRYLIKLVLLLILATSVSTAETPTEVQWITGSRTWKMKDGTTKRLKLHRLSPKSEEAAFGDHQSPKNLISISQFAPEEQAIFALIQEGKIRLCNTPGLNMIPHFPLGKITINPDSGDIHWYGELRNWENLAGKTIRGRLICLTDEDVCLRIGDTVSRVELQNLSVKDLAYLEQMKRGECELYMDEMVFFGIGWDGNPPCRFTIPGEHYAALTKREGDFEHALASAVQHVRSKLRNEGWEVSSFEEKTDIARSFSTK